MALYHLAPAPPLDGEKEEIFHCIYVNEHTKDMSMHDTSWPETVDLNHVPLLNFMLGQG
jgi:hypothetical protein